MDPEGTRQQFYFGVWGWHPKWLQVLANAKFFTFILCVNGFVEGALVSGKSPFSATDYAHSPHGIE